MHTKWYADRVIYSSRRRETSCGREDELKRKYNISSMRESKDVDFMKKRKVDIIKTTEVTLVLNVALYLCGELDRSPSGRTVTSALLVLVIAALGGGKV